MTFIVRSISRTTDGREIVRSTTYNQDRVIIGRDAASEVHLADLAIELHHAEIRALGGNRIEIQSVCGLGFTLDGRRCLRAEIDAAIGGELLFGGHRLRIGQDSGGILVTVERVEALSEARDRKSVV